MKIALVVSFLVASVYIPPHTNSLQSQPSFTRVERIGEANARSFFVFSTSERNYAIRHDGHGEGSSTTVMRKNFNLRMDGAMKLERVYFAEFEGDLLLAYEVTTPRGNWAYLARFNQKKMFLLWVTPLSVDRLGPGVIEGSSAYFGAANYVFKIEMKSGGLLWQKVEESRGFELPVVRGESVIFSEEGKQGRIIEVDKQTGSRVLKSGN